MNVACSLIFLKIYEHDKLVEDVIKIIATLGFAADASTLIPTISNFIARNDFSDNEVLEFCQKIASNIK